MVHQVVREIVPTYKELCIFFFGDEQDGSPGYKAEYWQEFEHQFRRHKNARAIGLGDYGDWLRPSMRARLQSSMAKDAGSRKAMDKLVLKDHDKIIDKHEFLKGKLLGLHEGHHTWELASGGNLDQRLAAALGASFLGWTASTRLVLVQQRVRQISRLGIPGGYVYTIVSTHGNANGRKVGSAANWLESNIVEGFTADQYVMGHGCKNASFVPHARDIVRRVGQAGLDRTIPRCLIVGGFSEGYTNGWDYSYVEKAGYAPQPPGWGELRLKLVQRKPEDLARGVVTKRAHIALHVEQVNVTPGGQNES